MKTKVKRISKRTLSLFLTLLMMVSIFMVGTISASAWGTGDTWTVLNNVTDDWTTGSSCMSSGNDRYYVYYVKYADSTLDDHQVRFRFIAGSETIGPGNGWYVQNAIDNSNSNKGQVGPANNGNAYFYAPLNNNTKWQRVLVGANASGNYFWASVTDLTDLSATCTAASTSINKGDSVKLTGSCSGDLSSYYEDNGNGGKKAVYTYQYQKSGTSTWTDIGSKVTVNGSGAGTDSTGVSFTPSSAGTYYVRVIVNDGNVIGSTNAQNDRYITSSTKTITVKETYAVTYNENNGTGTPPSGQTKIQGTALTLGTNNLTRTGYTPNGWNTNSSGTGTHYDNGASYTTDAALSLYAQWTPKTSALTFNLNGGSGTAQTGLTATYGSAMPSYTNAKPTKAGYTFAGFYDAASGGTQYYTSALASAKNWDKNTTDSTALYAHWTEVKAGATVKAYTDGVASSTGGTVKVGTNGTDGATATTSNSFGIDTASPAIIKASTAAGYEFKGWQFNSTHLKYSFDGTDYTAVTSTSTTYGTSSNTTVYLKTDGTSGLTTANTEVHAMFESAKYTITYSGKYTDDGAAWNDISATQGTFTVTNNSNSGANVASGSTVNYQNKLTVTATPAAGYVVDGIYYKTTSDGTWNKMTTATNTSTGAVYNNNFNVESNWFFEARFKKIYHISLYNTTEEVGGDFRYISGPPMRVTVTPAGGTAVTYTYKKNAAATSEGATRTESGNYNEGDLLTVYAGDTVVLTYAALASSDTITGVFFNNSKRYTCEGENDNLYKNREYKAAGWGTDGDDSWDYDYMAATTLYANENYYEGSVATTIAGQKANYQAKDGVDNNMHTVTFVAKSDYLNIDLEIATKRQFIFTDETGLDIRSEMMDNYYNPLSEVSASSATTKFGIKLATSDTCSYAWGTGDKVKFYRDAACTNEVPSGTFTVASSADANGYFVISGTMPNYNVYIKPNIVTKYQVSLGTVMLADVSSNNYSYWNQAADVSLNYGGTKYKNEKYDGITAPDNCIKDITKGDTVTFKSSNYNDKTQYTFLGWYKGTAEGPDYKNGLLSEKETFNFIPRANTYVYAVGTRDLFINGSKYITGATNDWNRTGSNDPVNFKMEFDPTKGTKGMYYWELDAETLYAAVSSTGYTNGNGVTENGSHWYWSDNTKMGNSWFQIMDSPTGWDRSAVWGANNDSDFKTTETNKIEYGKVRKSTGEWTATEACGYIKFKESDYPGWSAPLRIYVDPTATGVNKGRFTVEPTPTYSNLYVSNGFDVGGTSRNTATTVTVPTGETNFTITKKGNGWQPDHEGKVEHYIPEKKNAKVRITKTCSANEKIVAFDIYDIDNDTFYSRTDVTAGESNTYYIDLQCTMQQNLYIVPVIQEKSADLTINFDGTQLNKTQWGDIVTAYAWYSNDSSAPALGAYPGQPMIVSDDGNTWTAKMPSKKTISGTEYSLAGILFTNYVDGNHSWLGINGVMGTVTYGGEGTSASPTTVSIADGGLIKQYNYIESGGNKEYSRANFKAQTYDYREPVAIYQNEATEEGVETTITFAMKDGDSSLISWQHSQFPTHNILTMEPDTNWSKLNWEYLTNSTGKKYVDLNGTPMDSKPTASYYVAAKGQVIYNNSNLTTVFHGGKSYEQPTGITYGGAAGVSFNYAVQWYVYDAQGNYITTTLSAAFADQQDGMSYIAKKLDDLGYAVDGKSVAICYDKPRYMYQDDKNSGVGINSGTAFDAYRFEGQWYATVKTEPVTVSVGVGMMTENGEVLADGNSAGYGSATAAYSTTYGTAAYAHSNDGTKSVTVALADANKRLVKLDADATNFIGWYYYDVNTGEFTKVTNYTSNTNFYPNFNADVTYYAMYEAAATYQYNYTGRESDKSYSVSGGMLTDDEMSGGNKVSMDRSDFGTKAPGKDQISIFKKTIDFNNPTNKNNDTQYILQETFTPLIASYSLTYYYPSTKGGDVVTHSVTQQYNTTVDLSSCNVKSLAGTGKVFMGWYEFDTSKVGDARYGKLLTTQPNYGFVMTKAQTIAARYGDAAATDSGWKAFIDDSEVNKEMTSTVSGTYYNDTIVRFRNGVNAADALPKGTEVGVLIFNDGKKGTVSNPSEAHLNTLAGDLDNGEKATIGSAGKFVTKLCKTVGTDVNPTYYNRIDFALRSDYTDNNGSKFKTYAYAKINGTYYWSEASEIGSYS